MQVAKAPRTYLLEGSEENKAIAALCLGGKAKEAALPLRSHGLCFGRSQSGRHGRATPHQAILVYHQNTIKKQPRLQREAGVSVRKELNSFQFGPIFRYNQIYYFCIHAIQK